jgi:fructose-1,6-bisphosphatase/inositol monophosphatase family enzyme
MTLRKDAEQLLRAAESAALAAGMHLRNRREEWKALKSSAGHDVKVAADRNAEALIVEQLTGSGIPFFSEEAGAVAPRGAARRKKGKTGLLWVVDPLDGSLNYHQGIPLCCVSIGLYDGSRALLGVVYDFNHNELFSGLAGRGAWLNHRPIRPSRVRRASMAVLATGFPVRTDFSGRGITKFVQEVQIFRKVRLLGSAALSLCYVACGRVDAYREENISFWDVAAGCAIVDAAGGAVSISKMETFASPIHVVASNGRLSTTSAAVAQ